MTYEDCLKLIESACGKIDLEQPFFFHEYSLLREDLGIDSVAMLRLLLQIELSSDWELPEDSFSLSDIHTVRDLALLILDSAEHDQSETPTDAITVHCLVSCFCDGLKQRNIDFRPMYFGIWDAPFGYENGKLRYHYTGVNHDFIVDAFRQLYQADVQEWYQADLPKQQNIQNFHDLLEDRDDDEQIIAMIDMAELPQRENKFRQSPFPHYSLFENGATSDQLLMRDVDFRWVGEVPRDQIFRSMQHPSVKGGFRFSIDTLQEASTENINRHFRKNVHSNDHLLTKFVRICLREHYEGKYPITSLGDALQELPVLAIRKYAYEHVFAYYWLQGHFTDGEFDTWCHHIGELAERYKQIQYAALKYSLTRREVDFQKAMALLDKQEALETSLKQALIKAHDAWLLETSRSEMEVTA